MIHSLIGVLLVFSCVIGYGLAVNHAGGGALVIAMLVIWIVVPASYVFGLLTQG